MNLKRYLQNQRVLLIVFFFLLLPGCSSVISGATKNMAKQLQETISNHNDPELVKDAVPAYMLMLESFLRGDPENVDLLRSSADLYTAYTGAFVGDMARQQALSARGFDYAKRALCHTDEALCQFKSLQYDEFVARLTDLEVSDVPLLTSYGAAWGTWLKANSGDFNAIADLPKITRLFERLVELAPEYQLGSGHLYLGIIHTLTPPAVGGKPDLARQHFERAIAISDGKNLMVKVTYAQQYARMLFDRELHDELLNQVLSQESDVEGLTLSNSLARQTAKSLLADADDYF